MKPIKHIYVVLYEDGSQFRNISTGTKFYTIKGSAINACPHGGKVIAYELNNPITVHEEPKL